MGHLHPPVSLSPVPPGGRPAPGLPAPEGRASPQAARPAPSPAAEPAACVPTVRARHRAARLAAAARYMRPWRAVLFLKRLPAPGVAGAEGGAVPGGGPSPGPHRAGPTHSVSAELRRPESVQRQPCRARGFAGRRGGRGALATLHGVHVHVRSACAANCVTRTHRIAGCVLATRVRSACYVSQRYRRRAAKPQLRTHAGPEARPATAHGPAAGRQRA